MSGTRLYLLATIFVGFAIIANPVAAQKKYDPGASDNEIKIGNTMSYSGPASAYALIAKTEAAYFDKINVEGGINGRKIKFISHDDGYSPPKTFEQVRKLVESDSVLLVFGIIGTAHNTAIQQYMNENKVPQLFIGSGAVRLSDPQHFPWTLAVNPSYRGETRIYAQYLLQNHPDGKIGILYQNDDYGREYVNGLKDALDGKMRIISEISYESSEPTIYSEVSNLQASGPTFFSM